MPQAAATAHSSALAHRAPLTPAHHTPAPPGGAPANGSGGRRRILQFFERTPPFSRPPLTDMARRPAPPHAARASLASPRPPARGRAGQPRAPQQAAAEPLLPPLFVPLNHFLDAPSLQIPECFQVSKLASGDHGCPELQSGRSCDLDPASWVAIAWYPLQRIPTGHTLKDMAACFLSYHSLAGGARLGPPAHLLRAACAAARGRGEAACRG